MDREAQIADKEKRIFLSKKKTQELDKFKFVLDYKIKELKRDIAPREARIGTLKSETNKMDGQLRQYNKVNANFGFIIDDLRTKQEAMDILLKNNRT